MAKDGEKLKLLDGQEVSLDKANTLVIADASQPLAMGGIMVVSHPASPSRLRIFLLEAAFLPLGPLPTVRAITVCTPILAPF